MPLAFGEEPPPAPLDRAIELDRRAAAEERNRDGSVHPVPFDSGRGAAFAQDRLREAESKDRGLPPLHRGAAHALDALIVALAAAVPLAIASGGIAPAPRALGALALPAAGFVALVAAAYALLSRALLAATPGRLAVARITKRDAPPCGDPDRRPAVRAP
jgi:hypothetical protein